MLNNIDCQQLVCKCYYLTAPNAIRFSCEPIRAHVSLVLLHSSRAHDHQPNLLDCCNRLLDGHTGTSWAHRLQNVMG